MEAHGDEKDDATVVREVVEGLLFRVSSSSMEMVSLTHLKNFSSEIERTPLETDLTEVY